MITTPEKVLKQAKEILDKEKNSLLKGLLNSEDKNVSGLAGSENKATGLQKLSSLEYSHWNYYCKTKYYENSKLYYHIRNYFAGESYVIASKSPDVESTKKAKIINVSSEGLINRLIYFENGDRLINKSKPFSIIYESNKLTVKFSVSKDEFYYYTFTHKDCDREFKITDYDENNIEKISVAHITDYNNIKRFKCVEDNVGFREKIDMTPIGDIEKNKEQRAMAMGRVLDRCLKSNTINKDSIER